MSKLIQAIYDYNLCTYYLLPLVRLNKFSFGEDNFIQCYVSRDGSCLYIELKDLPEFVYHKEEFLGTAVLPNGNLVAAFALDPLWRVDFVHFVAGKYSKLSRMAKDAMLAYSGLPFNQYDRDQVPFTDARIMAIDPDPTARAKLRQALQKELGVEIPVDQELISVPSESNYIDVANITKSLKPGLEVKL